MVRQGSPPVSSTWIPRYGSFIKRLVLSRSLEGNSVTAIARPVLSRTRHHYSSVNPARPWDHFAEVRTCGSVTTHPFINTIRNPEMWKDRATIGTDGKPLPLLPPERDARVWARLVRVMFYLPGFMALLLVKSGEPTSFGISVELLMLASAAAIVGGLFIGTQASGAGADSSSKVGTWSGALVLELLSAVPFLCAVPSLFHELAHSAPLHARVAGTIDVSLGASELLPAMAILPFLLYQLAGFGTMHYIVPKVANWLLNLGILVLIMASYIFYRQGDYAMERHCAGALVVIMAFTVLYGVLKLKRMQEAFDALAPHKDKDKDKDKDEK